MIEKILLELSIGILGKFLSNIDARERKIIMDEYKVEVLINDPEDRVAFTKVLDDLDAYEQTNFDGARFVEIWLKPIGTSIGKFKDAIVRFAKQEKIAEITVKRGDDEVVIKSIHPKDLNTAEDFAKAVIEAMQ